jgi:electron transfer flavoprotein beta subunit
LAADEQALGAALAGALRPRRPALVLCGDRSADRGTGALPAFLAHELGAAQALGLVSLTLPGDQPGQPGLTGDRRLPGGWRERLWIGLPAVCSVEAAGITLRRAPLHDVLASRRAAIPVVRPRTGPGLPVIAGPPQPYRPRTHEVPPAPAGTARERLAELSGVLVHHEPPVVISPASPAEAAQALLDFLGKADTAQGDS